MLLHTTRTLRTTLAEAARADAFPAAARKGTMDRRSTVAALLLLLAGAAAAFAAPPKHAARPQAAKACVPDEPSFWKDQALTSKVAAKLSFHKPLLREKVEVKATGGAVMLSGNMSSQALIAEAVKTASAISGVKCVQNFLRVGPPLPTAPQQP